jgi:histone-lysine N-methyltransferase SETMAR
MFKSVALHLWKKGYTPIEAFHEIKYFNPAASPELSTLRNWFARMNEGSFSIMKSTSPGKPPFENACERILAVLEEHRTASIKFIAETVGLSEHTVRRRLVEDLKMKKMSIRWIPYKYNDSQIESRKSGTQELANVIRTARKSGYRSLLTGDEMWVYLENESSSLWLPEGSPRPECARKTVSSAKVLVTVFFSGEKFWHLSILHQHEYMNSTRFIETVLHPLQEKLNKAKPKLSFPILLQCDNAPCHNSTMTKDDLLCSIFSRVPAPPYSPDISPSDFFFFGYLKSQLKGKTFKSEVDLMKEIKSIIGTISSETLYEVFDEWLRRCEVIAKDGCYI